MHGLKTNDGMQLDREIVSQFKLGDTSPNGLVASEAFHWLAAEKRHVGPKFILAFGLTSEEFYEIPLPTRKVKP